MIEPKSHAWLLTIGGCPVRSHFFAVGYFGLDFPERFPEIPTIDIFLDSAKHGFYISIDTVHPSMLLG